MLSLSTDSGAHDLFHGAKFYNSLNFSIIPVYGNASPERPKVAAVDWKQYQTRRAGDADFQRWFLQAGLGGIAIVTGSISRLVVLDFDDADAAADFAKCYPHLIETRTVQSATRRTLHYYYALPAALRIASRKAAGVDLLSDGRYVIAPPTRIGDSDYRLTRGGQPRLLTQRDMDLIEGFIANRAAHESPVVGLATGLQDKESDISGGGHGTPCSCNDTVTGHVRRIVDAETLIRLYRYFAPQVGRNQALFRQACYARDCGWTVEETTHALADIHTSQPPNGAQPPESAQQRQREAEATIQSAFSRPPGKTPALVSPGLPNPVREIFLKQGSMPLLRVLDGLYINGVKPGMILTEKSAGAILKPVVGRYSIMKALQTLLPDGSAVFERANPSPGTPSHTDVAASVTLFPEQIMLFVGGTKPDKKPGRPAVQYRMPDIARLCAALNVTYVTGDTLQTADLRSTKAYREGLHRELIKRRPGVYGRDWLANRLGVTVRSMRRYRQGAGIQAKPVFREIPITWHTMGYIPVGIPTRGVFLEDETGKRYPPLREIARKLLRNRKKLRCMFQCENHYSVKESSEFRVPSSQFAVHSSQAKVQTASQPKPEIVDMPRMFPPNTSVPVLSQGWSSDARVQHTAPLRKSVIGRKPGIHVVTANEGEPNNHSALITSKNRLEAGNRERIILPVQVNSSRRYTPELERYYRQPLQDFVQEETANTLYTSLRSICPEKQGYMSLPAARQLVDQYGCSTVKRAVQVVKSRRNIATPAGFVIAWLRSETKSQRNRHSQPAERIMNALN